MSKTLIITSVIFFIVSISVNIFASILEKIVDKKKLNAIKNNKINDIENEKSDIK